MVINRLQALLLALGLILVGIAVARAQDVVQPNLEVSSAKAALSRAQLQNVRLPPRHEQPINRRTWRAG